MPFFECRVSQGTSARMRAGCASVKTLKDPYCLVNRTAGGDFKRLPARIGHGGRRFGSTLIRCPEREAESRSSTLYGSCFRAGWCCFPDADEPTLLLRYPTSGASIKLRWSIFWVLQK